MGFFSGYDGKGHAMAALAGLGRLTKGKTGPISRDARRVVSAFMRGEITEGACKKNMGCAIVSEGNQLVVTDPQGARPYVLAKRPSADSDHMDVCVPPTAEFEEFGPVRKDGSRKRREAEGSSDIRAASSALLKAVGAGIGVKTDESGLRYLSGSKGRSRLAVPGSCVRVKFSKRQRMVAAEAVEALKKWSEKNPKGGYPTAAQYAKSRAAIRKEMAEVRRLMAARAAEERNRERGVKGAEARVAKLSTQLKKAEERLFKEREKAGGYFNPEVMPAY